MTELGDALAASVSSCSLPNGGYDPVVEDSTLWLAGSADDGSPAVLHVDSSMHLLALVAVPSTPITIAVGGGTVWAITSAFAGAPADLIRVDTLSGMLLSDTLIPGTHVSDGAWPPASIAVAGDDTWVSIANGPMTIGHYRRDGTLAATVPISSPPDELAAVNGHAYLITTTGEVVAIDAATNMVTALATLPLAMDGSDQIAAAGDDLWAGAGELVHIDLTTGAITARRPAVVMDLAADPHQPGRAWAAAYEPDPNAIPGIGAGAVVRLAVRGVQPDGVVFFDTIMGNGINQLAIDDNGTTYGETGAGQFARIVATSDP